MAYKLVYSCWSYCIVALTVHDIFHQNTKKIIKYYYQARAERGILTKLENSIPGQVDSIGALKMYILEKRILGTQISMLKFYLFKELPGATFLCFKFSTTVPKNGQKNSPKFKKRRKMTKTTFPHLGDPI